VEARGVTRPAADGRSAPAPGMAGVLLRQWRESDLEPYREMNTDPEVMRFLPALMTRQEASDSLARLRAGIEERGWGVWAVEVDGAFAGMAGLSVPRFAAPFMPCTEALWRMRREFWGRGLARAAAEQALEFGFSRLGLAEIVAFTAAVNLRSIRLMERLGFSRDPGGDFDHPALAAGHPLRRHVLYRKGRDRRADPLPAPPARA
jgi:RimJ/RimL family protein N-acetyltransferase